MRFRHSFQPHRCPHARDDVFSLRLREVLTVRLIRAVSRIAREAHAGARVVVDVPENHLLYVYRRAAKTSDAIDLAILDRARRVPRFQNRDDALFQLFHRVLLEDFAVLRVDGFEFLA